MTREEAIENLELLKADYWDDDGYGNETNKYEDMCTALDMAISALSENKGEWIPVSERLPKKNVWVLVTVEQNEMRYQEIMRRNNYKEGWTDNIDFYTDEITAWQPLPEPYKEGGE